MTETPDVRVRQSDHYRDIRVTGQAINVTYDGLRMTILNDTPNLENAIQGDVFRASKLIIDRSIECTLNLSPTTMKAWAMALQHELEKYETTFGPILSPEEIAQKLRDANSSKENNP